LAFGVSKSNSGIIHPGTQNPVNSLKGRLCVQGNLLTRKIAHELGVDFKQVGELIVAFNEEERLRLLQIIKDAQSLRVPGVRMVDEQWLRKNEPNLNPSIITALYAPTAGIISPYRWVYDLAQNAANNGVEIFTQTKVLGLEIRGNEQYRFIIDTDKSRFSARYLINAAGLFADDIARMAGINDFEITPRKGEEFILDKKREDLTNHLIFPLPSKESKGILIIKTSDGNPMIGPTAQDVDDKLDLSTSGQGLQKVLAQARRMIPAIDDADIIAYFAGLRPAAGDDFIVRAEANVPGVVTVAGIQSPGLTCAPAIAVLVRNLLQDSGIDLKKKLWFHKYRKKSVHLFAIALSKTEKLIKKDPSYGDIVCRCEMVSAKEIRDAIKAGASTLDGIKFRTRAQAGRCHGSFCTTRVMKILSEETQKPLTQVTKRGKGSEIVQKDRSYD
jgi:glycerol-3-phosphate dehydrogenase